MRSPSLFAPYAYGALLGLILSWFSLWNGFPLITQDTPAYISRPASVVAMKWPGLAGPWADAGKASRQVQAAPVANSTAAPAQAGFDERIMASRSVYYGLILFALDAAGGMWGVLAFQALVAGCCLALLAWRGLGWRNPLAILGLGAIVAFGAGASLFAGLAMPDLFAATAILSATTLFVFWDRLLRLDRWLLSAVMLMGCVTHDATLLIVAGLTAAAILAWPFARRKATGLGRAILAALAVLILAAGASAAFSKAAEAFSGYPPARFPYLTAHLVDTDEGAAFIKADCQRHSWAVCAYRSALPMDWNAFLFDAGPGFGGASSLDRQRLSQDDMKLAAAFATSRPMQAAGLAARETLRQLTMIGLYDVEPRDMAPPRWEGVPAKVAKAVEATRLWRDPAPLRLFSNLTIAIGAACAVLLAWALYAGRRRPALGKSRLLPAAALIVLGLLANAVVCGVLASPYDRFQARVMWLIPMLAYCVLITGLAGRAGARAGGRT